VFEGEFAKDNYLGYGRYIYFNCDIFEEEFEFKNGKEIMKFKDGIIIKGYWNFRL